MAKQEKNNIKLGFFVLAGLFTLILSFYIIGKNNNLFGSNFQLRVRFSNLSGLTEGNNVLFSGIQAGTVKKIELINDSTLEVSMQMNSKIKGFIRKNALASVGTEGLMGNKVVNIVPGKGTSALVTEGDLLGSKETANMEEILGTLSTTNNNVAAISEVLKGTVLRIDSSEVLKLLNDKEIGLSLKASLRNIYKATANAQDMTGDLNTLVAQVKNGKGTAGLLLTDTSMAGDLKDAIAKMKSASTNANNISVEVNNMAKYLNKGLTQGKGPLNTLLRDSIMAKDLSQTMENLQKGTDGFNQNMEALKHNFFFRGYFRKLEQKKKEDQENAQQK